MYPGLTEMQVRAIFEAACNMASKGVEVHPEDMIPLTSHVNELREEREKLEKVGKKVMAEKGDLVAGNRFGNPWTVRDTQGSHSRTGCNEQRIGVPMIAAIKFYHQVAPGYPPGQPHCAHGGFRS